MTKKQAIKKLIMIAIFIIGVLIAFLVLWQDKSKIKIVKFGNDTFPTLSYISDTPVKVLKVEKGTDENHRKYQTLYYDVTEFEDADWVSYMQLLYEGMDFNTYPEFETEDLNSSMYVKVSEEEGKLIAITIYNDGIDAYLKFSKFDGTLPDIETIEEELYEYIEYYEPGEQWDSSEYDLEEDLVNPFEEENN